MTAAASSARIEANRRNARRSTGPRTPEGKERSRLNALKHGMTAATTVLPGEDPEAFHRRLEDFAAELEPRGAIERFLVERAAVASWKMERADRVESARLSAILRAAATEPDDRRPAAEALGRLLLADGDAAERAADAVGPLPGLDAGAAHPRDLVALLEATSAGCEWLLGRWAALGDRLDRGEAWPVADLVEAVRLRGRRPLDADADTWRLLAEEVLPGRDPALLAGLRHQLALQLDERTPADEAGARASLWRVVARETARLERRASALATIEAADAAERADRLSFEEGAEAERLRRYQSGCGQAFHRALGELVRLRRAGLGAAEEPVAAVPGEPAPSADRSELPGGPDPSMTPVGPLRLADLPEPPVPAAPTCGPAEASPPPGAVVARVDAAEDRSSGPAIEDGVRKNQPTCHNGSRPGASAGPGRITGSAGRPSSDPGEGDPRGPVASPNRPAAVAHGDHRSTRGWVGLVRNLRPRRRIISAWEALTPARFQEFVREAVAAPEGGGRI